MVTKQRTAHNADIKQRTLRWLIALLAAWMSITAFFWPLIQTYPSAFTPSHYPDALEFIWTAWRMEDVISGATRLYYAPEVFAPTGASLLLHTVCEGILIPVTTIFSGLSPTWRVNAACMLLLGINAASALSLFRALGCHTLPALFCSLLVIFAPFSMGHLHAGHLNFLVLFPLLESIRGALLLSSLTPHPAKIRSLNTLRYAGAVSLLALTNLYFLYFTALISAVCVLYVAARSYLTRKLTIPHAVAPLAPFFIGLTPVLAHLVAVARIAVSGTYTPDHNPAKHAADLAALIAPSPVQTLGSLTISSALRANISLHAGESSLYLGAALTLLAFSACWTGTAETKRRAHFFLGLALFFAGISLGPFIVCNGVQLSVNPLDALLRSILPMYPSVPARFAGVAGIALIIAASQNFTHRATLATRLLQYGLLFLACVEFMPAPVGLHPLPLPSPALSRLAATSGDIIIADLSESQQSAMLRQTVHEKPIVGGFLSRQPRKASSELRRNRFSQMLRGRSNVSDTDALRDWCRLRADVLIVERSTFTLLKSRLIALGFTERDSDQHIIIFTPSDEICSG